jgi:hypothetical protein
MSDAQNPVGRPRKAGIFANTETETLRAPMREEDPRAAAAKRAAEIRGHIGDMDEGTDDFYVDPSSIPDGWTYEWKRHTVFGSEDPAYQVHLARSGWAPVPASRHPEMMPMGSSHTMVLRKGCILMERPTEIVEERRAIEQRLARNQVRQKEAQIAGAPDGTMTRDHASARPNIKKGYSPIAIPD